MVYDQVWIANERPQYRIGDERLQKADWYTFSSFVVDQKPFALGIPSERSCARKDMDSVGLSSTSAFDLPNGREE